MKVTKSTLVSMIQEELEQLRQEKKEKKKKVACPGTKGSPWHGLDGKFVNPEDEAGSWSRRYKGSGKCKGQTRRPAANRRQVFTKVKCGRDSKYRCKDGSAKWGEDAPKNETLLNRDDRDRIFPGYNELRSMGYGIMQEIYAIFEEIPIQEGQNKVCMTQQQLKDYKSRIIQSLWQGISNYEKAKSGKD